MDRLPQYYKHFCFHYGKAKRDYKKEKARYWKRIAQAKMADWRDEWAELSQKYKELRLEIVSHISSEEEIMPRQLAYLHLGYIFDVGPDQMRRIINKEINRQKRNPSKSATKPLSSSTLRSKSDSSQSE